MEESKLYRKIVMTAVELDVHSLLVTMLNRFSCRPSTKTSSGSFVFGQNMGDRVMVRI